MAIGFSPNPTNPPQRRSGILVVATISVTLSVAAGCLMYFQSRQAGAETLRAETEERLEMFSGRLDHSLETLDEMAWLMGSIEPNRPRAFRAFAGKLLHGHPELELLAWAPRVQVGTTHTYRVRQVRARGDATLAVGHDLCAAIDSCAQIGAWSRRSPVRTRILTASGGSLTSLRVAAPIYGHEGVPTGLVFASIRVDRLLSATVSRLDSRGIDVYLFDAGSKPEMRLVAFESSAESSKAPDGLRPRAILETPGANSDTIDVGGERWLAIAAPTPTKLAREHGPVFLPVMLSLGGVWITLLVVARFFAASDREARLAQYNRHLAEARDRLAQSQHQLQQIGDLVPHLIFAKDADGRFLWLNRATSDAYGATMDQLVGRLQQGDEGIADDRVALESGERQHVPEQVLVDSQGSERVFETTKIPYSLEGGGRAVLTVAVDISDRRRIQATARRLEQEKYEANKMEALSVLAGGLAHQFNNLLGGILGYTELVQSKIPKTERAYENLTQVMEAGQEAAELVKQIQSFGRKSDAEVGRVEVAPIVADVIRLLESSLPAMIRVSNELDAEGIAVCANAAEIHHVILNICTNAYQAIGDRDGDLFVGLETADAGCAETRHLPLAPGSYVRIRVRDTGHGMDDATAGRAFVPFFTTRPVGQGTGMGLSVAHGIVTQLGGHIDVASTPGRGTTMDVYLPQADDAEGAVAARRPEPAGGVESVLVVDDEPQLLALLTQMLEQLGYRPTAAADARQAIDLLRRDPDGFDAVVTDQSMPGMSGTELAGELLALRPDLPIIIASGYNTVVTADTAHSLGIRGCLGKPYLLRDIDRALRDVLDGPARAEA